MKRLECETFKVTRVDKASGARVTIYCMFDRDHATGRLMDCRLVPKTRSGTVFEDLMAAVSDRIGKEIRRR